MSFSCDTFVCMKDETKEGYTALVKNSDRHPNEAMEVVIVPEIKIDDSTLISTTYTTVKPPKSHSHRCALCKPIWMWGAEMGFNAAGVCIGNEAVYANISNSTDTTEYLTGMDLLRLALMFGDNALDAVKIIDHYLQHYPQSGNMEWMAQNTTYYSTYLVADYSEVWIVETINQFCVAKKFIHGIHVISNRYTLAAPFDMISQSLRDFCDEHSIDWKFDLDIQKQFGQWIKAYVSHSSNRQKCVNDTLENIAYTRKLDIHDLTQVLRSHKVRGNNCGINQGLLGMDICAHASYGPFRKVNTVGSLICIMRKDGTVSGFVTGTSAPCLSMFKPIFIGCTVPKELGVHFRKYCNGNFVAKQTQTFDNVLKKKNDIVSTANMLVYHSKSVNNLWWTHEMFHRLYLRYLVKSTGFNELIRDKISGFEQGMFKELVTDYDDCKLVHCTDCEIVASQQKIIDKYWKESYKILDEMKKETENEIINQRNKANDDNVLGRIGSLFSIFNVFNAYSLLTKYLHQSQWAYWNRLAGICISQNGTICDTLKNNNTKTSVLSSLFRGNGVFRWIKILLISVWGVLLFAIALKLLN